MISRFITAAPTATAVFGNVRLRQVPLAPPGLFFCHHWVAFSKHQMVLNMAFNSQPLVQSNLKAFELH
jgi:hypothetical protein